MKRRGHIYIGPKGEGFGHIGGKAAKSQAKTGEGPCLKAKWVYDPRSRNLHIENLSDLVHADEDYCDLMAPGPAPGMGEHFKGGKGARAFLALRNSVKGLADELRANSITTGITSVPISDPGKGWKPVHEGEPLSRTEVRLAGSLGLKWEHKFERIKPLE